MTTRPFHVELIVPFEGCAVVALQGEVDLHTAPQFKEALLRGINDGARRVIVDLTKVSFIDSTVLGVVIGGVKLLAEADGSLAIVCSNAAIKRLFELTGLDRILAIYAQRAEALAASDLGTLEPGSQPA